MKIIICNRILRSPIHIHAGETAKMIYVPEKKLAIGLNTYGTFGTEKPFLSELDYIIKEGEELEKGKTPHAENCRFENIKTLLYDDELLEIMIEKLRKIKDYTERVKTNIEVLF